MIIVKLTVLSFIITVIYVFVINAWAAANPKKSIEARLTGEYPKWSCLYSFFVLFDIIGTLVSAIYLLFFR